MRRRRRASGRVEAGAAVGFGPKPIQDKLFRETAKALQVKTVQDKLIALGGDPFDMTQLEFDAFFRAQIRQNRELVEAAGIQPK